MVKSLDPPATQPESPAPSREQAVIQMARDLLDRALVRCGGEFVGAIAAIPQIPHARGKRAKAPPTPPVGTYDLNYTEVFIRDNIPVMIYLLVDGRSEIVKHFLNTCLRLQSTNFQTCGIFPTSFFENAEGKVIPDYGQRAIGRVASADATLWWPILAHIYVQHTGDRAWALQPSVQQGLKRFLDLILQPSFHDAPTLQVPDGSFMIDRPLDVWGAPLEVQTLLHGALLSAAGLLYLDLASKGCVSSSSHAPPRPAPDSFTEHQVQQFKRAISWAKRLRQYLLKHYWVNTRTVQVLRQRPTEQYGESAINEYNIQTETIPHWLQHWMGTEGGYLIGNIRTGRPDFRFFTLGNCLGAIFDILSPYQQHCLFELVVQNRTDLVAQMPLRICHPPLEEADWRTKTGYDRKNLPWCYHNGGHWPCLLWYLAVAALRYQQRHSQPGTMNYRRRVQIRIQEVLHDAYDLLLERLPQQSWAEYFDGPTGLWTGQQTRYYQTWTISSLLLVHHLLKVNPADANVLDMPSIKFLSRATLPHVPD
ncbi:glycoside hydrolase 100 family protein [Candidatus Cyanaurora vandensis]|uniref:glycoside hydrolase 100 family protein n=1 Tax=Candidatus Cyanaurora vandensis TaxID=2714958 RepID=UPI00257D3EC1|nr:glycoside hydrolase 100 family protein [Candidatus Cyanaurora vandensis]